MIDVPVYLVAAFSEQPLPVIRRRYVCSGSGCRMSCCLVAQQHNQSETAFVVPESDGFALRWFTTRNEVNLCGHATLARRT